MSTTVAAVTSVKHSHRIALVAKYLGPTNYRGSRIRVKRADHKAGDPTLTVEWDPALNSEDNYEAAVAAFVKSQLDLGRAWDGRWVLGATDTGVVAVLS